jgi:hypothetical protein
MGQEGLKNMVNNVFVGDHSVLLINMSHVIYAKSEGPHGGNLVVFMIGGIELELKGSNADSFRKKWRECAGLNH